MPVFNESATVSMISRLVLEQGCVSELVIVDDCSFDGTWEHIMTFASDPRVKTFRHTKNHGKGAAIKTGAVATTGEVVVVQDGDLEYDPVDFASMLYAMEEQNADVVYGSRFLESSRSFTNAWHRLGNRCLTLASNAITGLHLTDEATCYKMFRREILSRIHLEQDGFGFCPEFTAKISRLGVRIIEVPISYRARTRAQGKKIRFRDGALALWCLVQYGIFRKRYRDLYFRRGRT